MAKVALFSSAVLCAIPAASAYVNAPTNSLAVRQNALPSFSRASPKPVCSLKMQQYEEISQEEYEELLRAAGKMPPKAKPAAPAAPANPFAAFGNLFGGAQQAPKQEVFEAEDVAPPPTPPPAPVPKAAPRAVPRAAVPKAAAAPPAPPSPPKAAAPPRAAPAAPANPFAGLFGGFGAPAKNVQQQDFEAEARRLEAEAAAAAAAAEAAAAEAARIEAEQAAKKAAPANPFGGLFGGFGGFGAPSAPAAKPAAKATSNEVEVDEKELRQLMMKSQRDEIKGYSLAGGKSAVPSRAPPKPAAQPRAAAPVSGVKVTQIRRGDGINYPQPGDVCTVHYVGKLRATKQVFDSSIKRGPPFTFQVGTGQVIRGWDEGVLQMSLGEKSQLVISPEYGYGATGQGPIPPNAELVFDVDLLAINGQKAGGRFAGGN